MIVVDASAVVHLLADEPADRELAAQLADQDVHVPALIDFEVASAVRGHWRGGLMSGGRAHQAIADFADLSLQRHQMTDALLAVLALRDNFTAYDASYVVLARALDVPLVAADGKLAEARKFGVDVRIVGAA